MERRYLDPLNVYHGLESLSDGVRLNRELVLGLNMLSETHYASKFTVLDDLVKDGLSYGFYLVDPSLVPAGYGVFFYGIEHAVLDDGLERWVFRYMKSYPHLFRLELGVVDEYSLLLGMLAASRYESRIYLDAFLLNPMTAYCLSLGEYNFYVLFGVLLHIGYCRVRMMYGERLHPVLLGV